jgi:small subunit ribosomal protein S5
MTTISRSRSTIDANDLQLVERVVQIRRVAKVTAGGRRLRFTAMVVVGDQQGHIGIGLGKATAVPDAVRKGVAIARRNLIRIPLDGSTIPHEMVAKHDASTVLLKPARPGTGIIAGNSMRAVLELVGATDVVTKSQGSSNPINVVQATLKALIQLKKSTENRRTPRASTKGAS